MLNLNGLKNGQIIFIVQKNYSRMKVVLLAGGFGTRLSEYTKTIPKPMINIGGQPMLLHIMKLYAKYGFKDFYIALGFKGEVIKKFFNKAKIFFVSPLI